MAQTILRLPQVKARTGLSRSIIYLRASEGTFPKPVPLGMRAVGWLESDIEKWIERASRMPMPPKPVPKRTKPATPAATRKPTAQPKPATPKPIAQPKPAAPKLRAR